VPRAGGEPLEQRHIRAAHATFTVDVGHEDATEVQAVQCVEEGVDAE
jgi:hypothetical protein